MNRRSFLGLLGIVVMGSTVPQGTKVTLAFPQVPSRPPVSQGTGANITFLDDQSNPMSYCQGFCGEPRKVGILNSMGRTLYGLTVDEDNGGGLLYSGLEYGPFLSSFMIARALDVGQVAWFWVKAPLYPGESMTRAKET